MTLFYISRYTAGKFNNQIYYARCLDDTNNTIKYIETGAPNYSCPKHLTSECLECKDIIKLSEEETELIKPLIKKATDSLRSLAEKEYANNPDCIIGEVVQTKKTVQTYDKKQDLCSKCKGLGAWINPRNSDDVRICFGCNGKCIITVQDKSKPTGIYYKNTIGTVIGRFNSPFNLKDIIVTIETCGGKTFNTNAVNCKLIGTRLGNLPSIKKYITKS